MQLSPVKAGAQGFSAGFLSLLPSLSIFSHVLETKQTRAPALRATMRVTALLLHSPRSCYREFLAQASSPLPQRKGLSAPSSQQLGFLPAGLREQEAG